MTLKITYSLSKKKYQATIAGTLVKGEGSTVEEAIGACVKENLELFQVHLAYIGHEP